MKNLLRLEELLMLGLALFLFSKLDYGWGWYVLLFLTPDLSMLGYLMDPRLGSWTLRHAQGGAYNLIHHKGLSVALYVLGSLLPTSGAVLMFVAPKAPFGHSSFDRVMGYGLKHEDAFQNTHLGRIGR